MFFEKMQKKRDFLLSASTDEHFVRLALGIEKIVDDNLHVIPGLKPPIIEALAYAVFRHRNFCKTEILFDTLVTHLGQYFGLTQGTGQDLARGVLGFASESGIPTSSLVRSSNREFLNYLFVQVACADDDSELVEDLGLGSEILVRMKKSIEIISAIQDAEADAPLLFLPDLDAQVAEIMNEMTKDAQSRPWSLQQHRLLYHVMYVSGLWQEALHHHGVGPLFETLVAIGRKKLITASHILMELSTKYPEIAKCPDALSILEEFALAYPSGEKKAAKTRWSLTAFGLELTQDAVAKIFLDGQEGWDIRSFESLPPEYQTAVIRQTTEYDSDFFVELIKNARPLSPKALSYMLKRLVTLEQRAVAQDVAMFILNSEPSPWLRKAACRSLATTLRSDSVDQVFAEVARSDKSASVRAEAQAALG